MLWVLVISDRDTFFLIYKTILSCDCCSVAIELTPCMSRSLYIPDSGMVGLNGIFGMPFKSVIKAYYPAVNIRCRGVSCKPHSMNDLRHCRLFGLWPLSAKKLFSDFTLQSLWSSILLLKKHYQNH